MTHIQSPYKGNRMGLIAGTSKCFYISEAIFVEVSVLALPDADKPFSVVCDASNFAIGSRAYAKG